MSLASIPAKKIVNVLPGVVSAGGTALDLNGLLLTTNPRIAVGDIQTFADPAGVSDYFGPSSAEALAAVDYFKGFDGSDLKPGEVYFARYVTSNVAAYVRGAAGVALATVNGITAGTLTVNADGAGAVTSSSFNLSGAASLTAAAALIQAAFTTPTFTVTYDTLAEAFVVTSGTLGASSSIVLTTTAAATSLKLTAATGAETSAGSAAETPAGAMDAIIAQEQNFAAFTHVQSMTVVAAVAFAAWVDDQEGRYGFVHWSNDSNNLVADSTTIAQYLIDAAGYSGTMVIYAPVNTYIIGAFAVSYAACLNTAQQNGRFDFCNRSQSGIPADITDGTQYDVLLANRVNCYGAFGTGNDRFLFMRKGTVSGDFAFWDSYINQIWITNGLQLAGMTFFAGTRNVPYSATGDALILAALQQPIDDALNFGAIRPGVTLSADQKVVINNAAGLDVSSVLETRGWYMQVVAASAQQRAARDPRAVRLWYTDGQSVQSLTIASLEVQ